MHMTECWRRTEESDGASAWLSLGGAAKERNATTISQYNGIIQGGRIRLFHVTLGMRRRIKHDICRNRIKGTSVLVLIQ